MALVQWREEFKIGVASVDHEHQELIDLINALHAKLGEPGSALTVGDYLGEIFARISAHFALEERIMANAGYDQFLAHKADHERLLDEIRDIMDDFEDHHVYDEPRFAARLAAWFTGHFKTYDARLHKHLPH